MAVVKIKRTDGTWFAFSGNLPSRIVTSLPATGDEGILYLTLLEGDVYQGHLWKQVDGIFQWIDVGGGTNNINDVKVNGVSVVDSDKIANVTVPTQLSALADDTTHRLTTDIQQSTWSAKANVSDIPTSLSQLSQDATHRLVTDTERSTWSAKADISDIPTTLAELSDDTTHRVVTDTQITSWTNKAETSAIPTTLAQLTDDTTHRLVTDTEKSGWSAKAETSDIPTTLSQLTDDTTHRLTTDTEKSTWNNKVADVKINGTTILDANKVANISIVDNASSTSTTSALSANMGKTLNDRINNLESIGRFLSFWNASTGLPATNPPSLPYAYRTGDYYIVGTVGSGTNYQPSGSSYTGAASTTTIASVSEGDYFVYDGSIWAHKTTTDPSAVRDVQLNGTSIVSSGIANLTNATTSSAGAMSANDKTKLEGIAAGAEVNVQSNWNETNTSSDAYIQNKPTALSQFSEDATHRLTTDTEKSTWNAKQTAITSSNKLSADLISDGSTNKTVTQTEKNTWGAKSTVSVAATGTSTSQVSYITVDGTEYKMADQPTEQTVTLYEDLYTYTNIGKITGASATNPVKVADAGDPLKEVFNAILGTETDSEPSITTTTSLSKSESGTGQISAGEVGASVTSKTATFTFVLDNTDTAQYGIKTQNYDTHTAKTVKNTSFFYPVKTKSVTVGGTSYNYNIVVELDSTYHNIITATTGTIVIKNGNYIYCNLSNNSLVLSAALPAGNYTTSAQTRCGQLRATIEFDNAKYEDPTSHNQEEITGFYTYLGNISTASSTVARKTHDSITTGYTGSCTIAAGNYYTYYKVTSDTTHVSTGWTPVNSTSISDIVVVASAGQYIWFASTQNKTNIYEWNDVSGKYNTDPTATTKTANQTIHTTPGQDVNSYYTYRTTSARSGGTNKKFKLA